MNTTQKWCQRNDMVLSSQWMISDHSKYCMLNQVVLKACLCGKNPYHIDKLRNQYYEHLKLRKTFKNFQFTLWENDEANQQLRDLFRIHSILVTYCDQRSPRFGQNEQLGRWRFEKNVFLF